MIQKLRQPSKRKKKAKKKARKKKAEPVDPNDDLCPVCRKRGILVQMTPMNISGMSKIKWNCERCYGAYEANMKERGTIRPYGEDPP